MESPQKSVRPQSRRNQSSRARPVGSLGEGTNAAFVAERARFHRFIASQIGDDAMAEDWLHESLPRALEQGAKLRRGESADAWFYRILHNAISDHRRTSGAENFRAIKLLADRQIHEENAATLPADWDAAIGACFRVLLPSLRPRYAEVVRRVDLRGEPKVEVGRSLKLNRATMDVLLHRARSALRRQLGVFCGAGRSEKCPECRGVKEKM